jgi:hypothetical protein
MIVSLNAVAQSGVQPLPGDAKWDGKRSAVYLLGAEFIAPEFIIGGEWTSTIRLVNSGTSGITKHNAFFLDSEGRPLQATFDITGGGLITDFGFSFILPAGGSIEAVFRGGADTQFGHVLLDPEACPITAACSLYGEVALRNRNATRPDFESVFPFEVPATQQYLLWDHRNGLATTLYLVSTNLTADIVTLEFRDALNRLVRLVDVTLPPAGARILTLHALAPETIGLSGTLLIRATNSGGALPLITATGLRINPSNSFTPLRTYALKGQIR